MTPALNEEGRRRREQQAHKITEIPTLPAMLQRMLSLLDQPYSSALQLEEVIRNDQALATKLLSVANSAAYGFTHKITTIQRAVIALGFQELRQLAVGVSLMLNFRPKGELSGLDFSLLWLHSFAVAQAAQILSQRFPEVKPDAMYSCGILHDLGKLILCTHFFDDLKAIHDLKETKKLSWEEAQEEYGLEHAELGGWVAEAWGLPAELVTPIRYHHQPNTLSPSDGFFGAAIIHVADTFANLAGMGFMSKAPKPLDPELRAKLNLTEEDFRTAWQAFVKKIPQIKEFWQNLSGS